jgi:hypothetical protein
MSWQPKKYTTSSLKQYNSQKKIAMDKPSYLIPPSVTKKESLIRLAPAQHRACSTSLESAKLRTTLELVDLLLILGVELRLLFQLLF